MKKIIVSALAVCILLTINIQAECYSQADCSNANIEAGFATAAAAIACTPPTVTTPVGPLACSVALHYAAYKWAWADHVCSNICPSDEGGSEE